MKKRTAALLLALCMVLSFLPAGAMAAEEEFEMMGGTLMRYNGPGGNVIIPDAVTEIGPGAFENCGNLMSVMIPDSVTSIGSRAFSGCFGLNNVQMPNMLFQIGNGAFQNCGIMEIRIPNGVSTIEPDTFMGCRNLNRVELGGVTCIGNNAFRDCFNLRSVGCDYSPSSGELPDGWAWSDDVAYLNAERIEEGAFAGCSGLSKVWLGDRVQYISSGAFSGDVGGALNYGLEAFAVSPSNYNYKAVDGVLYNYAKDTLVKYPPMKADVQYTIPDSVTTIAERAFEGCADLTSVTIPTSVNTIGQAAFRDSSLTAVTIPQGVTQIADSTFEGCGSLTGVTIPSGVTSIGESAFKDCTILSAVTIPNGVKTIKYGAFENCDELTTLAIPDSVESIKGHAFYGCDKLGTVTIGSGVKDIGSGAFHSCKKLTSFTVAEENTAYKDMEGVLFNESGDTLIQYPVNRAGVAYTVPDGVKTIESSAFEYSANVAAITLPEGLETIKSSAFEYCSALTSMTLPTSLKTIENWAFAYSALTDVTIPKGIETLGNYTFYQCKGLTGVTLPESLKVIKDSAFCECTALTGVTIPAGVKEIGWNAFKGCTALADVKILTDDATIRSTAFNGCGASLKVQVYADSTAETFCIQKNIAHTIMPRVTMAESMLSLPGSFQAVYNKAAHTPDVTVKDGEKTLTLDTDYTVTYENNINAGQEAKVIVTGKRNYSGSVTKKFTITPATVTEAMFTVDTDAKTYTGTAIIKAVTGKDGDVSLTENSDYTVAYQNNTNAGTAAVTITGKGNYQGTVTKNFTITPATITEAMFTADTASAVYTGYPIAVTVSGANGSLPLTADSDYTVAYQNNTDAGTAAVTITGKGNYQGTVTKSFTIAPATITEAMFAVDTNQETYTGAPIEKAVSGTYNGKSMAKGTDYTVEYENNINVGTATVKITGKGNYDGTVTKNFSIASASAGAFTVNVDTGDEVYTGVPITKTFTVTNGADTLVENTHYTVSYANNVNVGMATITITGKGNYGGMVTKSFSITPAALTEAMFTMDTTSEVYTGCAITKMVTGKNGDASLTEGSDYTVAYENNIDKGTATVKITGKGNYDGTVTKSFSITPATITEAMFTVDTGNETHTGAEVKKEIVGKHGDKELKEDVDYTVKYNDNIDIGTATMTITGIGNYMGELTKTFKITKGALREDMFTVDQSVTVYTGLPITRTVTGQDGDKPLTEGTDYSVEYSDNINAGTATISIKGMGSYGGTITKTFIIAPASLVELTPVLEGTAKVGQTLTARLDGVESKEYTWVWTVGGIVASEHAGDTYTVKAEDQGKTVSVKAAAVADGNYTGVTKDSAALTVAKENTGGSGGGTGSGGGSGFSGSSGSGGSSRQKEINVTIGEKTTTVTVTIQKKDEGSVATVTGSGADSLVGRIQRSDADNARLDFGALDEKEQITAELPARVIRAFAEQEFQRVTLCFRAGEVELSGETLKQLSQQGKDKTGFRLAEDEEGGFALTVQLDGKATVAAEGAKIKGKVAVAGNPKGIVAFLADEKGNEELIRASHYLDGYIIATLSGSSSITVRNAAEQFDDVPAGHWSEDDVAFVSARGLMNGLGKNKFEPDSAISRAMVVTILYRLEGEPTADGPDFSDVTQGKYYYDAVAWAAERGIIKGYKDATFRPNGAMTREELAATLYRYAEATGMDVSDRADLSVYTDVASVSGWAKDAVEWMVGTGLLQGMESGRLDPLGSVTRAQMAAIMTRYFEQNIEA